MVQTWVAHFVGQDSDPVGGMGQDRNPIPQGSSLFRHVQREPFPVSPSAPAWASRHLERQAERLGGHEDGLNYAFSSDLRQDHQPPGNKRLSRLFPIITDGAKAVPCSETDMT